MAQSVKRAPASKQSVAYDYSRLARPIEGQAPQEQMQVHKGKATAKVPYVKYGTIVCGVFAALMVIVFSYMRVTELTAQNAALKSDLETLESDAKALDARKEQIFNLTYVEDRARNALGMMKSDKSSVEYLDLSQEDRVEIPQESAKAPAFINGLVKSFNAVVEYLN